MFYDLLLQRTSTNEGVIEFRRLLSCCLEEEYHTVAVNRNFSDTILTAKDANDFSPVTVQLKGTQLSETNSSKMVQLSRATLEISDTKNMQQINDIGKILETYDIVAVKPKNERIFHSICTQYDYYDIITFDMGEKIPFMLKRNPVYEAIRKGKYFEICLSSLYDSNRKRVCLTNCINIIKATKGKNLIISSDVAYFLYHRSGYDICSLLISLGLKKDQAYRCVTDNPKKCVAAARHRKTFKGVVTSINEQELKGYRKKQLLKIEKFAKMTQEKEEQMAEQAVLERN